MSSLGESLPARSVQWPAIIAGAVAAAGVSFTLHAFAAGIGLSAFSTAPTWRDFSFALVFLSGLYVLFVGLAAFALGGYIAGHLRPAMAGTTGQTEFRDGLHGLVMWGLAIVMTALLALGAAMVASPAIAPSGSAGATQSVGGENIIAAELDELFRSDNGIPDPYRRAEAARILLKSSSHDGVPNADRDYLATIVARITGLPLEESMARVDQKIDASAQALRRARTAAVLQAVFAGIALFVGAAVAWFASVEGGRERDAGITPIWDWKFRRTHYPTRTTPAE